jgi:hypothetical protein
MERSKHPVQERLFDLSQGYLNARGELVPETLRMAAYASGARRN